MTTVEELVDFCKEPQPVGAILLSGEWGCGKTYLIEKTLSDELQDSHIIIRISLFGISSISEINERVNTEWFQAYLKQNEGVAKVSGTVRKLQKKLKGIGFLSEKIKGIAEFNPALFFEETSKIGDREVVLVFDDLERTRLDTIDVLGCINEYCENKGFHTIIVANEEWIALGHDCKLEKRSDEVDNAEEDGQANKPEEINLEYRDIKEKIIQQTVRYHPDYKSIISQIITNMVFRGGEEYRNFLKSCEAEILNAFAPEGGDGPHNIRSLKCALQDFYRVYVLVKKYGLDNLHLWLSNFLIYMLAYKANIAHEGAYGRLFIQDEVKKYFPQFNSRYMLSTVENWILHGEWDEIVAEEEIKELIKQQQAKTPFEVLRCHRIIDVDEELIEEGFNEVLQAAYNGRLSINEYVTLIENAYWAREYGYPVSIDWERVQIGIRKQIAHMKAEQIEEPNFKYYILEENQNRFSTEEWNTYSIIRDFRENRELIYYKNKKLYCETLINLGSGGFSLIQNKMYDEFDQEMAEATFESFKQCNNSDKAYFSGQFNGIWGCLHTLSGFKVNDSIAGMRILLHHLQELEKEYEQKGKVFSKKHTNVFEETVQKIIDSYTPIVDNDDGNDDGGEDDHRGDSGQKRCSQ